MSRGGCPELPPKCWSPGAKGREAVRGGQLRPDTAGQPTRSKALRIRGSPGTAPTCTHTRVLAHTHTRTLGAASQPSVGLPPRLVPVALRRERTCIRRGSVTRLCTWALRRGTLACPDAIRCGGFRKMAVAQWPAGALRPGLVGAWSWRRGSPAMRHCQQAPRASPKPGSPVQPWPGPRGGNGNEKEQVSSR